MLSLKVRLNHTVQYNYIISKGIVNFAVTLVNSMAKTCMFD